jgi:hypothetical protein
MSQQDPKLVTFAQLNEQVGSFFSLWAMVERTVAEARKKQGATGKGNLRATIEAWAKHEEDTTDRKNHHLTVAQVRTGMIAAIDVRNHFAHGLVGKRARLHPHDPEAHHVTCLNEETRTWTYQELTAWMTYTERLDGSVWRLTGAAKRREVEVADMYRDIRKLLREAAPPGCTPLP